MSDVTLKIDADTAAYIAKIAKMAEAHEGVNEKLKDHGKFADHLTHGLERALFKAIAIKEVAEKSAEFFLKASQAAAQLSGKVGPREERVATDLMTLGFGGESLEGARAVVGQEGGTTSEEQRNSFLSRLAGEQKRRRDSNLPLISQRQFYEAFNSYRQGGDLAFGEGGEELTNIFTNARYGYGIGQNINQRANEIAARRFGLPVGTQNAVQRGISGLPTDIVDEQSVKEYARWNEQRTAQESRSLGVSERMRQAWEERMRVEHPTLMFGLDLAHEVPAVGRVGEATSQRIEQHYRRQDALNNRRIIREDAHDEGKK